MVHALLCALAALGYAGSSAGLIAAIGCFPLRGQSHPKLACGLMVGACFLLSLGVFATVLAGRP